MTLLPCYCRHTVSGQSGAVNIVSELWDHQDEIRSYVAITDKAETISIRMNAENETAELFVVPANPPLEMVLFTIISGLLKVDRTVFQKHRARNISVFNYPEGTTSPSSNTQ